ncbi:hypothetical protein AVEN_164525-1, partial [Araneus ventricosus]
MNNGVWGDIVVRYTLRVQRSPGSKLHSNEDPRYVGLMHVKSEVVGRMSSHWCDAEA